MKAQTKAYTKDDKGRRTDVLKSAWKRSGKLVSLKQFARGSAAFPSAATWLHNKKANTSAPAKKIGRTNRIKSGNSKK